MKAACPLIAEEESIMQDRGSEDTRRVADAILEDIRGAGFYRDPVTLTRFLEDRFGPRASGETARQTAEAIVSDLDGAGYYRDPQILAQFLEGRLEGPPGPQS